ncbi:MULTISPECIES: Spy/CpxP family protein refolding chaperone [unclassified Colwellia]|uniref:Spy/CpxP family protein refolding chaperone n=1 Tax=unclassified Colwellia TaxID=196834 RepID=UPI0015F6713E|nr:MULTISPECIES: Spy/CpxP family protein refolding chaperone [unclassified Colwellia]MBA6225858.1 Spy/CpxP family protein refolding chaperone [Colwellia sp. MB3u-45]MBA6267094.1 Spy/CpxP family protein refolding chaperone [Colwellia sp. MB3u-43]MBA6290398.1 Spy/CpxP family protein refolding chaperone [Colwellia sp. MB3u-4]MBA6322018.1 Spy/CpxP family protein refolding chaperone [Colwellia sp. MB02u-19]MBA6325248.1 Spy/CpxP family protein refolding chaperone [Colwellia sp. MB02u-18]
MNTQKLYSTIKPHAAVSILVLSIISLSSFSANAMGHENKHHSHHNSHDMSHQQHQGREHQQAKLDKRLHHLAKKLDLSQAQRSEIKLIFVSMTEDKQAKKRVMSDFKAQVKPLLQASEFDENQFAAIYAEHQLNFQQAAMERAKVHHGVMQVLTAEQQQKFLTMGKHR